MSRTHVVGRRLRRFLGTLLSLGFGASWWSFVPTATAAVPVVVLLASPPAVAPPRDVAVATLPPLPAAPRRPHVRHRVAPVVIDPPPVIANVDPRPDPVTIARPPVVELPPEPDLPEIPRIVTRSS